MKSLYFFIVVFFGFSVMPLSANDHQLPEQLPPHPRIYLTEKRVEEIKSLMKTDPFLKKQVEELQSKAARMMEEVKKDGYIQHVLPDKIRLLAQSWRLIERTTTFAFIYRMTGQQEYADVAIEEMLNVCRFPDWNPVHYFDAGEMSAGVALGYDWLYDVIPVEKRNEIRKGLIQLGMLTGHSYYVQKNNWHVWPNNWNEVCNNGMILASFAIADEDREMAEQTFQYAIKSMPVGLSVYAPEGTYPEGGNYWNYGTLASCMSIAALQDVLGSDLGFLNISGLKTTGDFFMGIVRPDFWYFNYSDCPDEALPNPAMFFLSRVFNRPDYAAWLCHFVETKKFYQIWEENSREGDDFFRNYDRYAVLRAIWYNPAAVHADFSSSPLAKHFKGWQELAVMRTKWKDQNAAFAALKAGSNRNTHRHFDIGSFVYDAHGYRWAVDLGRDMASYKGFGDLYNYFRFGNRGHNTLLIADSMQNKNATCHITHFESDGKDFVGKAVADITDAYANQVKSAIRTITLKKDGTLIVEDQIEGAVDKVRWTMITPAKINIKSKKATLKQGKKKVSVTLQSNEVAKFEELSAKPTTDYENQNEGYTMLAAFASPKEGKISIKVVFKP